MAVFSDAFEYPPFRSHLLDYRLRQNRRPGSCFRQGDSGGHRVDVFALIRHHVSTVSGCFKSFIAEQNHRINRKCTSSRDQSRDDANAQHGKNHTAKDDRIFWCRLIHDR